MKEVRIYKLMEHKGAPRLWLQDKVPERAQLLPGVQYSIETIEERQCLVLRPAADGTYTVSRKKDRDRFVPVIDLNSEKLLGLFRGLATIRVIVGDGCLYILPLASEVKKRARLKALFDKLNRKEPILIGSIAHGAGVLTHAVHHGLAAGGVRSKLAFAIDIWPEALDHARGVNDAWSDSTMPVCMPVQELLTDDWVLNKLPVIQQLEIGIPCTAHSRAGVTKKKLEIPEADEAVGHLIASLLAVIGKVNPAAVLFECVEPYLRSASMSILRNQLRDWGYILHETVLHADEWGALEARERMCVVAVTEGLDFDFPKPEVIGQRGKSLSSVLEDIPLESEVWREVGYLKAKELRDREQSKGFAVPYLTGEAARVPTLRKGYHKGGSCDARLLHPTNPNLSRLLTAVEHARIKGVCEKLISGLSNTFAHELLGQGICPGGFFATAKRLALSFLEGCGRRYPGAASETTFAAA